MLYLGINIGKINISYLMFFWGLGIIFSQIYYILIRKKWCFKLGSAIAYGIIILFFEIICAKLLFLLENINDITMDKLSLRGGYSLFGVFLFMPFFLIPISKFIEKDNLKILDFSSIGILIELSFYRIGCYYSGCCGGITFSNGFQFPTQIVEACLDALVSIILILYCIYKKKQKSNLFFGITYLSYGAIRFIIEFLRVRENIFWIISPAHIFSLITMLIGVIVLIANKNINNK